MIAFQFTVNRSFLNSPNHPITIPKGNTSQLIREFYDDKGERELALSITLPKGRTLNGKIYYGVSGWGPYYQIKIIGDYPGWYLDDLRIGDALMVAILKNGGKVEVELVTSKQVQTLLGKKLSVLLVQNNQR